jgi:lysophospholipid acyltransferase (LPLAT)-like uncharacterized protein
MKIRLHPGITSYFGAVLIRLLGCTWRIEWRGLERLDRARGLSKAAVIAFCHGRLLVLSFSQRSRNIQVLASEHPDGDLMGRTIARLGFGHVKGSSTRRGAAALRELATVLRNGLDVGLAIDGPRGPRGVVQQGAIELSRMTGAVVVPMSNSARPRILFNSWDRFQLPLPFAKVVIAYGEPFVVPGDSSPEDREKHRLQFERYFGELTASLDRSLGFEGPDVWPHEDH